MQPPVPRRRRRPLLLLQRPRACARPVADGRRDAPGHPPGRDRVPVLHRLVRTVGRPRDLAVALPRRRAGPPPLPSPARAASPRTGSASRCSRSPCATGSPGRAASRPAQRRRRAARATTPAGATRCCAIPGLREVAAWNLVHRAAQAVSDGTRSEPAADVGATSGAAAMGLRRGPHGAELHPGPGPHRRRHQVRPGQPHRRSFLLVHCTCGTRTRRSASSRTRPTATCGRWGPSSCSATCPVSRSGSSSVCGGPCSSMPGVLRGAPALPGARRRPAVDPGGRRRSRSCSPLG